MTTNYDVIIIGSGLGGLTAAATLAKEGLSVLILEQYHKLGGFAQSYTKQGYTFDTAIHAMWLWEDISEILAEFGEKIDVVTARRADRIILPEHEIWATSIPEMKEQIQNYVPHESANIGHYYDQLIDAQTVLVNLMNNPQDWEARRSFVKYRNLWKQTQEEVIHHLIKDPMARSLIYGYHDSYLYDYGWHYPAYHLYCTKYLYDSFQPVGGSQPIVDALVRSIKRMGGTLITNSMVKKIIIQNNEAKGVILENGEQFSANKAVISNADAILTLDKMIGRENLPNEMQSELDKWKKAVPSLSYYILNLGLDIDVRKTYDLKGDLTVYYPSSDVLGCLKKINTGILPDDFWLWMVFPSFNDSTLAPPGHSVAIFSILVPYNCEKNSRISQDYHFDGFRPNGYIGNDYYQFKEELTNKILEKADKIFPGISSHIKVKDTITPMTIERTTLNYQGSTLGVVAKPELEKTAQKGFNLSIGFKMKTLINKLYLAGGWTESGFSASAVIGSGRDVAFNIIGKKGKTIAIDPSKRLERLKR